MAKKPEVAVNVPSDDCKYDEYAVKRALETLKEAESIRLDEKMMGLVQKAIQKEKRVITSLEDLKSLREEMNDPDKDVAEESAEPEAEEKADDKD